MDVCSSSEHFVFAVEPAEGILKFPNGFPELVLAHFDRISRATRAAIVFRIRFRSFSFALRVGQCTSFAIRKFPVALVADVALSRGEGGSDPKRLENLAGDNP